MSTEEGYVKLYKSEIGVGTIEFFHPQSNSLPSHLLNKLALTINNAGKDDSINVIILRSGGDRTFCAGASFDELSSISNIDEGLAFFSGFAKVINAARKCPKLIIGRVQGKAVGGGVGMASAVDYCFATKYASVKLSELAIGIGPFVVGPAVERKMGLSGMSTLAINATKWFDAKWAMDKGLYAEIFETTEEMDEQINLLSDRLGKSHKKATTSLKKILWEGTEQWDNLLIERAKISGELILSEFSKNSISLILKK
jgi:methylglutaconyl-CoA hydratase